MFCRSHSCSCVEIKAVLWCWWCSCRAVWKCFTFAWRRDASWYKILKSLPPVWQQCYVCLSVCVCFQGMSETFSTLHGLVNKGVNVVMDIPYELWNETSAEVAELKKQVLSPEFTGMSENPSSNNIYVKCIFLLRETNCGAPTAGSSRDKVSVRLTQSKIYCCQKKDRMLKLHHKWKKSKEGTLILL